MESQHDGPITVLVADDHDMTRRQLAAALALHPRIVVVGQAKDGLEAVRQAEALSPAVVLMDVRMPGVDGLQAARAIRGRTKARVVLVSSYDDPMYHTAAAAAGAAAFMAKSSSEAELVAAVLAVADDATPER